MDDRYTSRLAVPADVAAAFALLTRWPVPVDHAAAGKRGAAAAWAWPLAGAALGLAAGLTAQFLGWIGVPNGMAVIGAMTILVLSSGAMHEDGLADTADGLGPDVTQQKRFEIMHDSRIGAFGATALVLALLARWNGLVAFDGWSLTAILVATAALSRAMIVVAMFVLQPAKPGGMAAAVGQPAANTMLLACGIAGLLGLITLGWAVLAVALAAAIGALPVMLLAARQLGGQTGDILGAVQITAEIAALAIAAAILT